MPAEMVLRQLDLALQDEKNAAELYMALADQESFEEIRTRLRAFGADCQRHVQLLHNLIALMGGQPEHSRPEIEAAQGLRDALFRLAAVDSGLARLHRVEALLLAERRCAAHWYLLHALGDALESEAVAEAVHQVEPDKHMHVAYLADLHHDLGLRLLVPSIRRALQSKPVAA